MKPLPAYEKVESGSITLSGKEITNWPTRRITEEGVGHIPQDRHKHGLVLDFFQLVTIWCCKPTISCHFSKGGILNFNKVYEKAKKC
ncbi:hypothetical protein GCM10020331_048850 [Ectobacillus funiculus]